MDCRVKPAMTTVGNAHASVWEACMAWIVSVVTALVVLCVVPAGAQTYPTKPIHILVPYAPGGITDIAARIVGAKLTEAWGQQVVVENKPGGNGFIAMTAGAKAAPDGYTLTMATVGDVAINPAMFKEMPYDVQRDFAPIAMVSDAPMVLAVHGAAPYKTVADVIAAAKAQPGRLSVGTPGNGSVNQIVLEWMALNTDTKFQHIPYKGGAPAAAALAGGDIPFGVLASSSAAPHVKSGRVRALAVTMAKRSQFSPDWPTLQQAGVKEVDASNWTALFAPKGTPQPIIDKLNAEVVKVLALPDVKERFAAGGVETIPSSAADLDARVTQEFERFKVIVQKANIRPD
jgi:tripartite-type tricarboxylate transporter receptor subunit TctC